MIRRNVRFMCCVPAACNDIIGVDATTGLLLQDMVFDRNYRQGISVISAINMSE